MRHEITKEIKRQSYNVERAYEEKLKFMRKNQGLPEQTRTHVCHMCCHLTIEVNCTLPYEATHDFASD